MLVVIKEPFAAPEKKDIDNTLESLQNAVKGDIEHVGFFRSEEIGRIGLLVNSEGKLWNLTPNFFMPHDLVVGTAVFVGEEGEDFAALTEEQADLIMGLFSEPSSEDLW